MFTFFAPGKWILAGEHAVLRGSPALVFPILSSGMTLEYTPSNDSLELQLVGARGDELKLLAWGVIENAVQRLGQKPTALTGKIKIISNIPVGAGLGASASLCAVVSRWCQSLGWLQEVGIYDFARNLEDLFHGESSGVDVAVALGGKGLRFVRGGERTVLKLNWKPAFYLSYSGQRGATSECVTKVKQLHVNNPELATSLDLRMRAAVEMAAASLMLDQARGFGQMVEAVGMANSCFNEWGLIEGKLRGHLDLLRQSGAVAVKPTGSGGGGYALSLWSHAPPSALDGVLIPAL